MYDVTVITPEFKGISIVKQHRMVTEVISTMRKTNHESISDEFKL